MSQDLGTRTGCAGGHVVLDEGSDAQPGVFAMDKFKHMVSPKVSGQGMIVLIPQDLEMKVVHTRYVDTLVKPY